MFRNYLKTGIRSLIKQKAFTVINILGLTLGLTCSISIMLWIADEWSFDKMHADGDRIYRMMFNMKYPDGTINTWTNAPQPLEAILEEEYPEIELVSMISWNSNRLLTLGEKNLKWKGIYASEDHFDLFDAAFLTGEKATCLQDKYSIVITESLAIALFGTDWEEKEILGNAITVEKQDQFTITAVVSDPPKNSEIQYGYVIPFEYGLDQQPWNREWGNYNNRMFVKLNEGTSIADFNTKILNVIAEHREEGEGENTEAFLYPIERLHLYGQFQDGASVGGRIEYIRIFALVSIFVLILACVNYMNLSTARSFRRAKEVGVRKVVGAGKNTLILQFITESVLVTLVALICALLLTNMLLPTFNLLTGKSLSIDFLNPTNWILAIGFLLLTGAFSGFYPAFVISGFKPARVLKGSLATNRDTGFLRKSLVVFQFFLSIFMIAGSVVVYFQIEFIMNRNLGLDRENVLIYSLNRESYYHLPALRNDLNALSEVVSVTNSNQNPLQVVSTATGMTWEGKKEDEVIEFNHLWVGYNFVETMGMELVEGRDFSRDFPSDSTSFLVNEAAVEAMGLENPVGSQFNGFWIEDGRIIGIIKDFHSNSIYNPANPLMVILDGEPVTLYIRTAAGKTQQAIDQLSVLHKKYAPSYPFEYKFMDQTYNEMYKNETVMSQLSTIFSLLAIAISCLGLIGLASLNVAQKVKEIGIRKVMGASVGNILYMLSRSYVQLILIAFVISIPVINYFITDWLNQFEYKIALSWWLYPACGMLVMVVALLSVAWQSLKAAISNPANSLRDE